VIASFDRIRAPDLFIENKPNGRKKVDWVLTTGLDAHHECTEVFGPRDHLTINLVGTYPSLTVRGNGYTVEEIKGEGGTFTARGRGVRMLHRPKKVKVVRAQ
jgi:hypothetical protein